LDFITDTGIDRVSVDSLSLCALLRRHYPQLAVRAGAGAGIDDAVKAARWVEEGADSLSVAAVACNRDFDRLRAIREAVDCDLQLTVDTACPPSFVSGEAACSSERFRRCLSERLRDPVNYLRAVWIRPEDLCRYERLGYAHFRIGGGWGPADALVRRVAAYADRRYDGNLLDIIGPLDRKGRESGWRHSAIARALVEVSRGVMGRQVGEDASSETAMEQDAVYIDNEGLRGFLDGMPLHNCSRGWCDRCGYCHRWAAEAVEIDHDYRHAVLAHTPERRPTEAVLVEGALSRV
jgi:collagenase-like PrtC family protease